MKGLFKSHKQPAEVVKSLKESFQAMERPEKKSEKTVEDVSRYLSQLKSLFVGSQSDQDPSSDVLAQLCQEIYHTDVLLFVVRHLASIDFEGRKDVAQIFSGVCRRQIGTRFPTVDYLCAHPEFMTALISKYDEQEVALMAGSMLRECSRHESLTRIILTLPEFYRFFDLIQVSTFDIASDAFTTFRDLLTRHKLLVRNFLESEYDRFFSEYQRLLTSENYVSKRQALKLLGELLLDRHNFTVMTKYIGQSENLKLMMNLLREKSRSIQFEAFHVFKIFVANPNKPQSIADILYRNQEKLVQFLTAFQPDRADDEQFLDEKSYLIKQIRDLQAPSGNPTTTPGQQASANSSLVDNSTDQTFH